ncbi:MAG: hypothetical protein AAB403_16495, partial [Planctomycetota bacterium]
MKREVRALRQHHEKRLASVASVGVYVDVASRQACNLCGGPLHVQKTTQRHGKTLSHGQFTVTETIHACPTCKRRDPNTGNHAHLFVLRQETLARLLIPQSTIGYDVMTFVGTER